MIVRAKAHGADDDTLRAELFHLTEQRGFEPIYESLAPAFQYAKTAALDTDHVYHRGTQEYELRGGRGSNAKPV